MSQIDVDARWTKNGDESFFGYKNHVKCDSDIKIIVAFSVTDASVYDSLEFVGLIDGKGEDVWVGCGCVGDYMEEVLWLFFGVWVYVCFRVFCNRFLSVGVRVGNWFIVCACVCCACFWLCG